MVDTADGLDTVIRQELERIQKAQRQEILVHVRRAVDAAERERTEGNLTEALNQLVYANNYLKLYRQAMGQE